MFPEIADMQGSTLVMQPLIISPKLDITCDTNWVRDAPA